MADRLDVLLGILLDKAAQKDVERGMDSIIDKVGELDDAQLDKIAEQLKEVQKETQALDDRFAQARQQAERLNTTAGKLSQISTGIFAAGTAVVAGASLAAQNYVKFVEQAGIQGDVTADRWIAASKRVKNAQLNLGQDAAQALLPVYEQIATLAEKVASFANAHPELVQAAINTGIIVAATGAIGLAVSKGIRLVADFKYLAATAEYSLATARFEKSVQEFLAGEVLGGKGGGAAAAAGGGLLSKAGNVAKIATLAVGEIILATAATNALLDAVGAPRLQEMFKSEIEFVKRLPDVFSGKIKLNDLAAEVIHMAEASRDARNGVKELDSGLRDFQQEANLQQATQSYIQYRQQEAQAEQQYMAQREQIVQQGAAQLAQIEANYAKQRTQLASQYASQSAQALDNFNYQQAQALEQFNRNEARAVDDYNKSRTQAREDYQKEETQSAQDHQREMQRLEEESQDRQRDLIAARDALGLVKERRDLARRQQQAEEDYSVERARRKQELRQRLADLDAQFQQEQERRREDFAYQQAQAAEQFARQQEQAKQQYEERVKQLDEQHRQELEQSRQQTAEKLREIEIQFRQEQITRRNAFYDILRDLNANLLNEEKTRLAYYQRMQQDLLNFLNTTANAAGGRGSTLPGYKPGFQHGGYTPEGAIRAHQGEWVADRETTNALERTVGGRLTQDSVRSLTNSSQTVNLSFPGGLVTLKMLGDILKQNNASLFQQITKGLLG